ncbi:hypothetical protein, partial [Bradyrhizobium sp. 151]|uniref:hypothetical protein n=1 Tax=Bradyrhizobium sp. 151 TaxID=2782626 RepID=UPI001FFAADF8
SISSFGRRPSSAHIAESKSLKNSGENTFCQSSVRAACPQGLTNERADRLRSFPVRRQVTFLAV